ncbi:Conserved hypothetical protein [gamma proteobacterium HdN1]|nr:Conserved hypothetical protein [gamma proteobacterium HdN1]
MALIDHYLLIKSAHVGFVMLSGSVFLARGIGALMDAKWPTIKAVRKVSMLIDISLLTAAILLLFALHWNPFVIPWLEAKLSLLLAYIGFGLVTLRFAKTQMGKTLGFVVALFCYVLMFSIARAHDPAGFLRSFM